MQDIVVRDGNATFAPEKYNHMRKALAACVSVDDCYQAQSQAAALAVYYKQVHDEEAERAAKEIKLRAWRRMSEIIAGVNVSKCRTQKDMVAKVRDTLGHEETVMITDSRIIQLIKLAGVPEQGFEEALANAAGSIDRVIWEAHPEKIAEREQHAKLREEYEKKRDKSEEIEKTYFEERQKKEKAHIEAQAEKLIDEVKRQAIMEAPDVGLTLTPKAKANLVAFSVMMDRKMHDQLRDAAHERRTTMWAILREASNYWFVVNGYDKV